VYCIHWLPWKGTAPGHSHFGTFISTDGGGSEDGGAGESESAGKTMARAKTMVLRERSEAESKCTRKCKEDENGTKCEL
jgi:hypothetical protein